MPIPKLTQQWMEGHYDGFKKGRNAELASLTAAIDGEVQRIHAQWMEAQPESAEEHRLDGRINGLQWVSLLLDKRMTDA